MRTIEDYVDWIKKINELDPDLVRFSYKSLREYVNPKTAISRQKDIREKVVGTLPEPDDIERDLYQPWEEPLINDGL